MRAQAAALCLFISVRVLPPCCSILAPLPVPPWPSPYWSSLVPGPYCRTAYPALSCCEGRTDDCSVPILDTRCYCDTFCNRTGSSDCCPDYFTHCEGLSAGPVPARVQIPSPVQSCIHGYSDIPEPVCQYRGEILRDRQTVSNNCNQCSCQVSATSPGCMEMVCTNHACILEEGAITKIDRSSIYSWRPTKYMEFWGKTLEEGINGLLGTEKPDIPAIMKAHMMSAVQLSYSSSSLPSQFSSLTTWPGLISPVSEQGWCASSWAVSATGVAGDRTSIAQGSPLVLSTAALLACNKRGPAPCVSRQVDHAWNILRKQGAWSQDCQDTAGEDACPSYCRRYRTLPAYRVGRANTGTETSRNMEDIMYEVMNQGPVQAIMEVYTDFFMYKGGVYQKTSISSMVLAGYHAVRIVGWGQEGPLKYWTVANSWGSQWGEDGFFRIVRGVNECQIEEFVMGVWPKKERPVRRRSKKYQGGT